MKLKKKIIGLYKNLGFHIEKDLFNVVDIGFYKNMRHFLRVYLKTSFVFDRELLYHLQEMIVHSHLNQVDAKLMIKKHLIWWNKINVHLQRELLQIYQLFKKHHLKENSPFWFSERDQILVNLDQNLYKNQFIRLFNHNLEESQELNNHQKQIINHFLETMY